MKFQKTNIQITKLLHKVTQRIHELQRKAQCSSVTSLRSSVVFPTTLILCPVIFLVLSFAPLKIAAQDFTQTIERSARFDQPNNPENRLKVHNIQGNVTVEGYSGDEIQVTARQEIEGTDQEIKKAREELEFVVEQQRNTVYIYLDAPFIHVDIEEDHFNYNINRWDDEYEFLHDITIRVPRNTHIDASTINNGIVTVKSTTRRVEAANVNGNVELLDITGPTEARTVNGDIDISYAESPSEASEYHTVNGTIEVQYPADLSADIRFKSMHGELYTDFENIERLQTKVDTDQKQNGSRTRYKVDKFSPIRIGSGGPTFRFQVLNGDVYIKKIQS